MISSRRFAGCTFLAMLILTASIVIRYWRNPIYFSPGRYITFECAPRDETDLRRAFASSRDWAFYIKQAKANHHKHPLLLVEFDDVTSEPRLSVYATHHNRLLAVETLPAWLTEEQQPSALNMAAHAAAFKAIGTLGDPAVAYLRKQAQRAEVPAGLTAGLTRLTNITAAACENIVHLAQHHDPAVRNAAMTPLSVLVPSQPQARSLLFESVDDENPNVRIAALRALAIWAPVMDDVAELFGLILNRPADDRRATTIGLLGSGGQPLLDLALTLMQNEKPDKRSLLHRALVYQTTDPRQRLLFLVKALDHPHPNVRQNAQQMLQAIAAIPHGRKLTQQLLFEGSEEEQRLAARFAVDYRIDCADGEAVLTNRLHNTTDEDLQLHLARILIRSNTLETRRLAFERLLTSSELTDVNMIPRHLAEQRNELSPAAWKHVLALLDKVPETARIRILDQVHAAPASLHRALAQILADLLPRASPMEQNRIFTLLISMPSSAVIALPAVLENGWDPVARTFRPDAAIFLENVAPQAGQLEELIRIAGEHKALTVRREALRLIRRFDGLLTNNAMERLIARFLHAPTHYEQEEILHILAAAPQEAGNQALERCLEVKNPAMRARAARCLADRRKQAAAKEF